MSCLRRMFFAAVAVGALSVSHTTFAQSVPFKGSSDNKEYSEYSPASGDYTGVGNGTHLGKHRIEGNDVPVSYYPPAEGVYLAATFKGTQVSIAANGDRLEAKLSGEVVLVYVDEEKTMVEGKWYPIFEITGGTGRFAKASGKFEGVAINSPFDPNLPNPWLFSWTMEGKINLGKKK